MEKVSDKLFNIIKTKFSNPHIKTLTGDGKETTIIDDADMFSFDFVVDEKNYGPIVLLLSADNNLEVYYGDNTSRTLDYDAKRKWEQLIEHLSIFARSNRLGFSLKHTTDLKYDMSNITDITESFKNIFESYYGTKKTSYSKQGDAKIIIRHSKPLDENDKRYCYINSIFIESSAGERFKLPFTKLTGARAMARHVTEGGTPYDLFGVHISEMVKDINTLGGFVRRSKMFENNDETLGLVETGKNHYSTLRKGLKQISGKRGYHKFQENWEPSTITELDEDTDAIRKLFTERSINHRVEEALPLLARLQKMAEGMAENAPVLEMDALEEQDIGDEITMPLMSDESELHEMEEITEFEDWAESVIEDVSSNKYRALEDFFSEEQPVGIDGLNIIGILDNIIPMHDLDDRMSKIANKDPEYDARPIIRKWLELHDPHAITHLFNKPEKESDAKSAPVGEAFDSTLNEADDNDLSELIKRTNLLLNSFK